MMRLTLSLSDNPATTSVERAIMEFRSARPVVIDGVEGSALVLGVETLDEAIGAEIGAVGRRPARLLSHLLPRPGAAGGRVLQRVRGVSRRRGPARSGGDRRGQARSRQARDR